MKFCPECGYKLEDEALFCGECGTRQVVEEVISEPVVEEVAPVVEVPVVEEAPVAEEAAPVTGAFCVQCGAPLEADALFCGECGTRQVVEEVIPEPVVEEAAPVVEVPVVEETPVVEEVPVVEEAAPVTGAFCVQCGAPLEADALFCTECGARQGVAEVVTPEFVEEAPAVVAEEPVTEKLFCQQCGEALAEDDAFCPVCGTAAAAAANNELERKAKAAADKAKKAAEKAAKNAQKMAANTAAKAKKAAAKAKKDASKLPLAAFIGAGVAVVAGLVLVILALCGVFGGSGGSGGANYITYLKDGEMYFTDLRKDEPVQVTDRLADDVSDQELARSAYIVNAYTALVKGESRIFYPDRLDGDEDGVSLYYRDLGKDRGGEKIDSEIISYAVNEKGNQIIYLKGEDGKLYRSDLKDKEKLASDVVEFYVTEDLQRVMFVDEDGDIFIKTAKGDKEKLVSGTDAVHYVAEDLQSVYYEKDGALYLQKVGADKVKIAKDLNSVIRVYEDGSVYFTTVKKENVDISAYIQDDLAEADAAMTEPAEPVYPEKPTKPKSKNYDTNEEYQKAKEEYNQACADYEQACADIAAAHELAWEAYWKKFDRDAIRAEMEGYQESFYNYTLHYFDGEEDAVLADGLTGSWARDVAWDAPVVAFDIYGDASGVKMKLSQINGLWEVSDAVNTARSEGTVVYLAEGAVCSPVPEDVTLMDLSADGKKVAYLTDINEKKAEGSLYIASIKGAVMTEGQLMDEDVYTGYGFFLENGKFLYFKEFNDRAGEADLYLSGQEVDYDVYVYGVSYSEALGALIYSTDTKDGEGGTLKLLKGKKPETVGEDIYTYRVTGGGKLVYLTDYSTRKCQGEMHLWGDKNLVDEDVVALLWVAGGAGEICGGSYYW